MVSWEMINFTILNYVQMLSQLPASSFYLLLSLFPECIIYWMVVFLARIVVGSPSSSSCTLQLQNLAVAV
jgi:hypothetical protein